MTKKIVQPADSVIRKSVAHSKNADPIKDLHTKERIFQVAISEFMQFGFSRVSMDDLANKLGMSKKTLYHYYDSKQDIIGELVNIRMQKLTELKELLVTRVAKNAFGKKMSVLSSKLACLISEIPIHVINDLKKSYPEIYAEHETHKQYCIKDGFLALLDEGKAHGYFRNDIPNDVIVKIHLTVVMSLMTPDYIMTVPYTPEQLLRLILQFTMGGICTAKGRQLMDTSLFSSEE